MSSVGCGKLSSFVASFQKPISWLMTSMIPTSDVSAMFDSVGRDVVGLDSTMAAGC